MGHPVEVLAPQEYPDVRRKRMLLANLYKTEGVAHLITTCKDDESRTYEQTVTYLRMHFFWIENANKTKTSTCLMHVQHSNYASAKSSRSQ